MGNLLVGCPLIVFVLADFHLLRYVAMLCDTLWTVKEKVHRSGVRGTPLLQGRLPHTLGDPIALSRYTTAQAAHGAYQTCWRTDRRAEPHGQSREDHLLL